MSMDPHSYSRLEYRLARLLSPFAPFIMRLTYRRLPSIDGLHILLCTVKADTASSRLTTAIRLLREKAPRRWSELRAHVRFIHVGAQRHRHGQFDPRLRSLRLDDFLLEHQSVETVAGFLALGSLTASMRAKGISVKTCEARHPSALRAAVKHVLQALGVTLTEEPSSEPAA